MQLFRSILEHLTPATKMSDMKISQEGLSLIKKFEGCELEAYKCAAGVWTIGYGSTHDITEGMSISQERADMLLLEDVEKFEQAVSKRFACKPLGFTNATIG